MTSLEASTEPQVAVSPTTVAILPLGTTEGHGPHLPHGTDTIIAADLARRVAERYPDSIVLPALPYGMSEHYQGVGFALTLSSETLAVAITEICESVFQYGVNRILVVNGHDGNIASIEVAARRIRKRHNITIAALEAWWWALPYIAPDEPVLAVQGGHAGTQETALVLAAAPELADMAAATKPVIEEDFTYFSPLMGVRVYAHYTDYHAEGQFADPTAATPEVGERVMDAIVTHLVTFLEHADQEDWRFGDAAHRDVSKAGKVDDGS
jgi:creatinine amidohydrolase